MVYLRLLDQDLYTSLSEYRGFVLTKGRTFLLTLTGLGNNVNWLLYQSWAALAYST